MPARILIIEDEAGLVTTLRDRLLKHGYHVVASMDGDAGLEMALRDPADLILLDIMLPGQSGVAVCERLRKAGSKTPVLFLTARRQTRDKVEGLKPGGDDYLVKPFKMSELIARVEALLRRANRVAPKIPTYWFGAITVDTKSTEVRRDGQPVHISAKEFQLLLYFLEHPRVAISREQLLREVWGYNRFPETRTVDVHVARLRQKIESDPRNPRFIVAVDGVGYKFVDSSK